MTGQAFTDFLTDLKVHPFVGLGDGVFGISEDSEVFVPPVLLEKLPEQDAPVVLISARGAAGKSRVAAEISRACSVPVWHLERDRTVNGAALDQRIANYLESTDPEAEVSRRGGAIVIVDSLDEARSRVSGLSWSEFLDSVAAWVKAGVRFVLFGRERTLEDVWNELDTRKIKVSWHEVSHFGEADQRQYVDAVARYRDSTVDVLGQLYLRGREAVLTSLAQSLKDEDSVQFVGYAPVLDAVAALLIKGANLLKVAQDFEGASGQESRLDVLRGILEHLLERDQKKVAPLAHDLGLDASQIYRPVEQVQWLLADIEGADVPDLSTLPPDLVADYLERIRPFVEDHPFRAESHWASSVFEAYVFSLVFHKDEISSQRVLQVGNSSGLLFDFVSDTDDTPVIDETQFAALHASVSASETTLAQASVDVFSPDSDELSGVFSIRRPGELAVRFPFILLGENSDELRLRGPLSGLTVDFAGTVLLEAGPAGLVLGPDLFIAARTLKSGAETVSFLGRTGPDASSSDASVVLQIRQGLDLPLQVVSPPRSDLVLEVDPSVSLSYPWAAWREDLEPEVSEPNERAVRFLNMYMNLTRAHGHDGDRGVFSKKLEGRQSLKGEAFAAALTILYRHGVAYGGGEIIYASASWEQHRFSGKTLPGQRVLSDVIDVWRPVLDDIARVI